MTQPWANQQDGIENKDSCNHPLHPTNITSGGTVWNISDSDKQADNPPGGL